LGVSSDPKQYFNQKGVGMYKKMLQVLLGVAFVVQLSGCFFVDRDHRDRGHEEHHDHDSAIDVHLHG
jgi:hypothetical protein